jgi:ferredoxin
VSAPRGAHRPTELRLSVDPIACEAFGYCAELLGEMVTLDEWGYPIVDGSPVPRHLVAVARKAARDCPRRALVLSARGSRLRSRYLEG